jgi:hypothetical protein
MRILILFTTSAWNISHSKKNRARHNQNIYIDLHVKNPLFFSHFNETLISGQFFKKKHSNIKFHENRSSESEDVPCGQTDGQTWQG